MPLRSLLTGTKKRRMTMSYGVLMLRRYASRIVMDLIFCSAVGRSE